MGAMLAGVVGGLLVTITGVNSGIGGPISIKAFLMVMIGGAGVVGGAIAGGFILGMMESVGLTVLRDGFAELVGASTHEEAARLLADVTLDGALDALAVPVLVVHGGRDRVVPPEHAVRIAAALGERAELRLEPEGSHSCNNLHTVVRPAVADWVCDRLR